MPRKFSKNWPPVGRSIASNGYVLIRVGPDHHLADIRGYAYEHRLVAEKKAGRRLQPGEQIHHLNGDKQDNRPENIEIMAGAAHHRAAHRKAERGLRQPGEPNELIRCGCGCQKSLRKFDRAGRPRKFYPGHNSRPDYVPSRVRLPRRVRSDIPAFSPEGKDFYADAGDHDCESNKWGAISIRAANGQKLGVKPEEFEVLEWTENKR